MKKKPAGKILCCLMMSAVFVSAQEVTVSGKESTGKGAGQVEMSMTQKEVVAKLMLTAHQFRLRAVSSPDVAIKAGASSECYSDWADDIKPLFVESEKQWGDFFSYALNFVGRVESNRAVVAFYNPWVDTVLMSEWNLVDGNYKMRRMAVCCGETWRGEPFGASVSAVPKWEQRGAPVARAVGETFSEFSRTFDTNYPATGKFVFIAPGFAGLDSKVRQKAEIDVVIKRMNSRADRVRSLQKEGAQSDIAQMSILASKARDLIRQGNRAELASMVKGKQNDAMLDLLFKSDSKYRSRLAYCSVSFAGGRGSFVLADPVFPNGFVILNAGVQPGGAILDSVEAHKFEDFRR